MQTHFNGLSPAEAERLAMLAEEASEIAQAAMKVLRHGYDSYHPDEPMGSEVNNRVLLEREITDLWAVFIMMSDAGDVKMPEEGVIADAAVRKHRFAHHQRG